MCSNVCFAPLRSHRYHLSFTEEMKFLTPIAILAAVAFAISCSQSEHRIEGRESIAPSGLTLVVCDATNSVLDCVVLPNDKQPRSVIFTLPKGIDEIRVFAVGHRIHKDFPQANYIAGRPQDRKWMGLGYVEAHIAQGILMAIDGNGFGPLKMNESLLKEIENDIMEDKRSSITTVKIASEPFAVLNQLLGSAS